MNAWRLSDPATVELRNIGRGSAGSIFEIPGHELVYKKGSNEAAMRNDADIGTLAYAAFLDAQKNQSKEVSGKYIPWVPQCHNFFSPEDTIISSSEAPEMPSWWTVNASRFPEKDQQQPGSVILFDRILPMPQPIRHRLIKNFFLGKEHQSQAMADPENADCLVRIYLGRLSTDADAEKPNSLRNFPLYLDNLQIIGLKKLELAEEMARGLAVLHWSVGTDAMDVEFVLGSTAVQQQPHWLNTKGRRGYDFKRRTTHMWMFDYDKCSLLKELDHAAAHRMVIACTGNDPYFPHPCLDKELWERFKSVYLLESHMILRKRKLTEVADLPKVVMSEWEEWGLKDQQFKDDFDPFDRSGSFEDSDGDIDDESEVEDDSDEEEDSSDEEEDDDSDDEDEEDDSDENSSEDDGDSGRDESVYSDGGGI